MAGTMWLEFEQQLRRKLPPNIVTGLGYYSDKKEQELLDADVAEFSPYNNKTFPTNLQWSGNIKSVWRRTCRGGLFDFKIRYGKYPRDNCVRLTRQSGRYTVHIYCDIDRITYNRRSYIGNAVSADGSAHMSTVCGRATLDLLRYEIYYDTKLIIYQGRSLADMDESMIITAEEKLQFELKHKHKFQVQATRRRYRARKKLRISFIPEKEETDRGDGNDDDNDG
jgi:hypothetical protein